MKMFKKLMAVVLTGALAVSMLTGCALGDAAKAKALENALNSKNTQGSTLNYDYNHKSSLDDKADKIWKDTDKLNKTAPTALSTFDSTTYTIGTKGYIAYVAEQPEESKSSKASWMNEADTLNKAVVKKGVSKTESGKIATDSKDTASKKDVDFGTAFVSVTKDSKTTHYVVVVFEVNKAA